MTLPSDGCILTLVLSFFLDPISSNYRSKLDR
jgi:hypothetical protein